MPFNCESAVPATGERWCAEPEGPEPGALFQSTALLWITYSSSLRLARVGQVREVSSPEGWTTSCSEDST